MMDSRKTRIRCGIVVAVVSLVVIAIVVGLVVGLVADENANAAAIIPDDEPFNSTYMQIPCILPGGTENANEASCSAAGCKWVARASGDGAPKCAQWKQLRVYALDPSDVIAKRESIDVYMKIRSGEPNFLGQSYVKTVKVQVSCMSNNQLRVKYFDPSAPRYEVPLDAVRIPNNAVDCSTAGYMVRIDNSTYPGVTVIRKSTGAIIFSTSTPALTFADQFLQLTVALDSSTIYGFGEHNHEQFKYNMNYTRWTIFTRDAAPVGSGNLYGAQMLYMNIEKSKQANGVFLLNSNAVEVLLHPDPYPAITYRVLGGVLDYYIFTGPSPEEVVQQYTAAVGRMAMPPYWGLGFMLSRWGYNSTDHIRQVVTRNVDKGIPLDVVFGDIDYMQDYLTFTYNNDTFKDFPEFIDSVYPNGIKFITILDPGIGIGKENAALSSGLSQDIFIKSSNGSRFVGVVWPGNVYYPDFTNATTAYWWQQMLSHFYNGTWAPGKRGIKYEGLWVDMNEPSNFIAQDKNMCQQTKWNTPPYLPPTLLGPYIYSKTLCMDTVQAWGKHYDVHSLYGHSMAMATHKALKNMFPDKRPFVLTRSNFAGTAKYATHWLGDNQSRWPQMKPSVVSMLEYSLFGFGHVGSDICGFWFETDYEMCLRWTQLGAFYPFARNHNGKGDPPEYFKDQDPAAFNQTFVDAAKSILETRYRLLPYLYTLFFHAHTEGGTVARPLLHEFVSDAVTHAIDEQFLWGPALLISPVLRQGQTLVNAYFPRAKWYDYFTKEAYDSPGAWRQLNTPLEKTNLHLRGGYVLPWQESANNTQYSRLKPFGLLVALDSNGVAAGDLFYDDGESAGTVDQKAYLHLQFSVKNQTLTFNVTNNGTAVACSREFSSISVLGITRNAASVVIDGQTSSFNNTVTGSTISLNIAVRLSLCVQHVVSWYN